MTMAAHGLPVTVPTDSSLGLIVVNQINQIIGGLIPKLRNIAVVEARDYSPADYAGPLSQLIYFPPLPGCLASYSRIGGNLAAIGGDSHFARNTLIPGLTPAVPSWFLADVQGTSFASPQAAAVAAWVWALSPGLPAQKVLEIIRRTAAQSPVIPNTCTFSGRELNTANVVDVYAAALATDNPDGTSKNLGQTTEAPARLWLLDVASAEASGSLLDQPDKKFTQADIAKFLKEFEKRGRGDYDYSRFDLNGNFQTGEDYPSADYSASGNGGVSRFDLDGDLTWTTARKVIEGQVIDFDELHPTDLGVLIYYAYSPLYSGNEYERTLLLLPYLESFNATNLRLDETDIVLEESGRTVYLYDMRLDPRQDHFVSRCGQERGTPLFSQQVTAAGTGIVPPVKPMFLRPLMANRLGIANASSCSSFVATVPSTGRWWMNVVARYQEVGTPDGTVAPGEIEYQMRVYLGEPDLAAPRANSFTVTARRRQTQTLAYGQVVANELNPTTPGTLSAQTASFEFHIENVKVAPH
jgi:hypothetical protein